MRARSKRIGIGLILSACVASLSVTACKGGEGGGGEDGACVDDRTYFQNEVWTFVGSGDGCIGCHTVSGVAQNTKFILQPDTTPDFLDANMAVMRDVAAFEREGKSLLLIKPSQDGVVHEGGSLAPVGSEEYAALEELVERFKEPVTCGESTAAQEHLDGVVLLTPEETFRKASLNLAGRLPTAAEEFRIQTGGVEALDVELDLLMGEEAFFTRIEEIFNDMFLVERYLGRDNAVDLLDDDFYPDARWYMADDDDPPDKYATVNPAFLEGAREYTNDSVAISPLKLASYLVENDLPFTQIVTADYMIVNPYSARAYGIEDLRWEDPHDPEEWQPGKIPEHPHAGVLTDPMWLNRFPTTDTNRNRHRSRMVYWFFLATDVLKLAERPIDPSSITGHNPTVNNPNCNSCHAVIDPVAGMLQNWDEDGNFNPREEGWYAEMVHPGFADTKLNDADIPRAAQRLAAYVASDHRFATAMVHHMYRGITGNEPILFPNDGTDPLYKQKLLQYEVQDRLFTSIAQQFIDTNFNLKTIVKEIVKSPYFRAKTHESNDPQKVLEVGELGSGRLLTPELLDRKITAVTGMRWTDRDGDPYLLQENEYLILYGGIDSDDVIARITEPNGIMSGIQYRMANEMSCRTVARDFTQEPDRRRYFPYVEPGFVPLTPEGFAIAEAETAIRKNIQHLHYHILGEWLPANDPEIDRTYELFVDTWQEGANNPERPDLARECRAETDMFGVELPEEQQITSDDDYSIRAWTAVVTYLLADYKFLYE